MPLRKYERDGMLYLRGTLRLGKERRSVYETSGIRVGEPRANERFDAYRIKREGEILDQLQFGAAATVTWTQAAARRLDRRAAERLAKRPDLAGLPDLEAWLVLRITDFFRRRGVADRPLRYLSQEDIDAYFAEVHEGHALATRMRALAAYKTVMNSAKAEGWIQKVPLPSTLPEEFDPLAQPVEKMLYPEEVMLFIKLAAPHLKPLLAVMFGTGRRSGELPFLSKTKNLRWEPGNVRLFLGVTKNGKPIHVTLPPFAVDELTVWLKSRVDEDGNPKDKHDALFLTDKGEPYSRPKRSRGGIFKTGFSHVKKRVATALALYARDRRAERAGEIGPLLEALAAHADGDVHAFLRSRIKVVKHVTPHWGRHNAASHLYDKGAGDHEVMDHMGWRDPRSARRYRWRSKQQQRRMAGMLDFGSENTSANSVQSPGKGKTSA